MKKIISLFIVFSILLSCSATSFATSSDETIVIDGNQYTVERVVTDTYSQAIIKNISTNEIVEDFIYYFDNNILVNNLTDQMLSPTSIPIKDRILPFSNDDSKYKYTHTERFDFSLFEYTTVALAAAIMVLNPGVSTAVITSVISYAITKGLSSIYVVQECYSYEAKEGRDYYLYSKRITEIYGDDDTLIGGPWTTYRKIREK